MRLHASCAAWPRPDADNPDSHAAILLLGPSASGKSDLLLRLIDAGWHLVADDQVEITGNIASAPASLAGLIEVRGLGIFRLPYLRQARLHLAIQLGIQTTRLPIPARHPVLNLPEITIDPAQPSAIARINLATTAATGHTQNLTGAFAL